MWKQIEALEDHPDLGPQAPNVGAATEHVAAPGGWTVLLAIELQGPNVGLLEHVDATQERALARTARAKNDDVLAAVDGEVQALEDLLIAEPFFEALDAQDLLSSHGSVEA
jgi:hypothetical protein